MQGCNPCLITHTFPPLFFLNNSRNAWHAIAMLLINNNQVKCQLQFIRHFQNKFSLSMMERLGT